MEFLSSAPELMQYLPSGAQMQEALLGVGAIAATVGVLALLFYSIRFVAKTMRILRYVPRNLWRGFRERTVRRRRHREILRMVEDGVVEVVEDLHHQGKLTKREVKFIYNYLAQATKNKNLRIESKRLEVKSRISFRLKNGYHKPVVIPGDAPPKTSSGKALSYDPGKRSKLRNALAVFDLGIPSKAAA